jgi:hypothetical protein
MSGNNSENQENHHLSPLKTEQDGNKICWSPRFEFDAPRYTNFSSIKFRETRRLLIKLVLNQEDPEESEEAKSEEIPAVFDDESDSEAFEDLISFTLREDSDSSDIDEWFHRFHPLHEPLRPMTPPGPLISPEKLFTFKPQQSLKASPLKLNSSGGASPKILNTVNCELNTPSKGPNTRIGLRSKPARVLKTNNINNSFDSSPSSLVRSNFSTSTNNHPLSSPTRTQRGSSLRDSGAVLTASPIRSNIVSTDINLLSSPIRTHTNLAVSPVRTNQNFVMSSPLKQQHHNMTPSHRLSSTSNPSSVTLSVSSLTKTFYNETMPRLSSPTNRTEQNDSNLTQASSPLKTKLKFSEGTSSPLRKAVGILQLEEEAPMVLKSTNSLKKRFTDKMAIKIEPKKHRPTVNEELEDIKKLLSQHNNRIRPHNSSNNNTNNNKKKS